MLAPQPKTWTVVVCWILQLAVAGLLLQTLFFKLTYAPQTQVIFADLGGRAAATFTALVELAVALLILAPGRWMSRIDPRCSRSLQEIRGWGDTGVWIAYANAIGAVGVLGVIGGAILTHLTVLGVAVPVAPGSTQTDGGSLFAMAVFIALASAAVAFLRRRELVNFKDTVAVLWHRHGLTTPQQPTHT